MAKARLTLTAGLLVKGQAKSLLEKVKREVLWSEPDAHVVINEDWGLLESEFEIQITHISDTMALALQGTFRTLAEQLED